MNFSIPLFSRQTFRFTTYCYLLGILFFSTRPDGSGGASPLWIQHFKNFLHIPAYAGLTYLLVISFGRVKWWTVLSAFCAAVFYGAANEIVQMSSPGRSCSWDDVGRNALGAAIMVCCFTVRKFWPVRVF